MLAPTANARVAETLPAREGRLARAGCATNWLWGSIALTAAQTQATAPLVSSAAVPTPAITRTFNSAARALTITPPTVISPQSAIFVLRFAAPTHFLATALRIWDRAHQLSKEVVATIRLRGPGMDRYGPLNLT